MSMKLGVWPAFLDNWNGNPLKKGDVIKYSLILLNNGLKGKVRIPTYGPISKIIALQKSARFGLSDIPSAGKDAYKNSLFVGLSGTGMTYPIL